MKIPFDELYRMPTRDRKYYILKHNEDVEQENEALNKSKGGSNITNAIDRYTDIEQQSLEHLRNR